MSPEERFVFVACGAAAHLETLAVALRRLRKCSANPLVVVTDARRNALPVAHDLVIDCPTPAALSDAQAAISSSVRAAAAGRAMRLSVSGWACWQGMSR